MPMQYHFAALSSNVGLHIRRYPNPSSSTAPKCHANPHFQSASLATRKHHSNAIRVLFTDHKAAKATTPPTTAPIRAGTLLTPAKARLAVGAAALTALLPGAIVDCPAPITVVCIDVTVASVTVLSVDVISLPVLLLEAPTTPGGMMMVLMDTMVDVIVATTLGEVKEVSVKIGVTVIVVMEDTTGIRGETVTVVRVPVGELVVRLARGTPVVADAVTTGGRIG